MMKEPNWCRLSSTAPLLEGYPLRSWLLERGSMTQRMQAASENSLEINVLQHQWAVPRLSEAKGLHQSPEQPSLVREVVMRGAGKPWMFARSVFSEALMEGEGKPFLRLGSEALGGVLFQDPGLKRSAFDYAKLEADTYEYQRACSVLNTAGLTVLLWARRSVFHWRGQPLLLIEVFLPELPTRAV